MTDEIVIKVSFSSSDGGLCTSTMENALDMAVEQAKELLKRKA